MYAKLSFNKYVICLVALMFVREISTKSTLEDTHITILVEDENREKRSESNEMPETLSIMTRFDGQSYPSTVQLISSQVSDFHVDKEDDENFEVYKLIDDDDFQFFVIEKVAGKYHIVQAFMSIKGKTYEVQPDLFESEVEKRERRELGKLKLTKRNVNNDGNEEDDCPEPSEEDQKKLEEEMKAEFDKSKLSEQGLEHVVEVCLIADYSVYDSWLSYYEGRVKRTMNRLRAHYIFIFEIAKVGYDQLTFNDGKTLKMSIGYFEIITNPGNAVIGGASSTTTAGLLALRSYILANSLICDVSTLFTKSNIGVNGVAYLGTACSSYGVNLVRDTCQASNGQTMAHEIGHNLDSGHDSTSECTPHYIMHSSRGIPYSSDTGSNRWSFSTCSRDFFNSHLDGTTCMNSTNSQLQNQFPVRRQHKLGGSRISLDEQCARFYKNRDSIFCSDIINNDFCLGMHCFDPDFGFCRRTVIPLEGTPCNTSDSTMICTGGSCKVNCFLVRKSCNQMADKTKTECRNLFRACRAEQSQSKRSLDSDKIID